MGRTGRGRTAGVAIAMVTALMVPVAAPAMADGGPGGPVLEPEIVLAEGLSAMAAGIEAVEAGTDAVLYRVERGGTAVAYGPELGLSREVPTVGSQAVLADGWVVDPRRNDEGPSPSESVTIVRLADGAQFTHEIAAANAFVAADAAGWVEVARTDRDVWLVQATIGGDGSIVRSDVGTLFEAAEGVSVTSVVTTRPSVAPSRAAVAFTLSVGTDADYTTGVFRYTLGAGVEALVPLGPTSPGSVAGVSDSAVYLERRTYSAGKWTSVLTRLGTPEPMEWTLPALLQRMTLLGERVLVDHGGGVPYQAEWRELLPDGSLGALPAAWAAMPWDVVGSSLGLFFGRANQLIVTDVGLTSERVVAEAGQMPLQVGAIDLEAGTAVWVDDSVAVTGSGTAWSRSLTLPGEPSLLVERATGVSIERMHGTTFVYRADDGGETFDLVRSGADGRSTVVGQVGSPDLLTGEARTLLAGGFLADPAKPDALIDVATGAVTPSARLAATSDTWRVSVTIGWSEAPSTITATHAVTGAVRTLPATSDQPSVQGVEIPGSTLVWLASGAGGATLHTVDLGSASSAVRSHPLAGDVLVAADPTHAAVARWAEDGRDLVDIYRFTDGGIEPVATLVDVVGRVAIDGGRVLWVEAGPDGDRLVAARIPGASLFSDVPVGAPFVTEIEWLVESGIGTGYVDGSFRPGGSVSRQAMAAFLFRVQGADFEAPATASFSDVGTGAPFFREVEWMAAEGLAAVEAGTFRPDDRVSRQAMAAFLYRAAGSPEFTPPATASFVDVPVTAAFFKEIEWLAQSGVTSGYADGTFRPGGQVSRQAMAAFLYRFAGEVP